MIDAARFLAGGRLIARMLGVLLLIALAAGSGGTAEAQDNPFAPGWTLDRDASSLSFVSVKNGSKVETSSFASFDGSIDPTGLATVKIQLDSVDTGIDLRNVRMRFLFFETFQHPEATVTLRIDPAAIADLATLRRKRLTVDFDLHLHGITQTMQTEMVVTLITEQKVSVASVSPIAISVAPFGLEDGVRKLEEAANVTILPSGSVSFDLVFNSGSETPAAAGAATATPPPVSTALETQGDFSEAECAGRFEILSRTGAIYFRSGSAEISAESNAFLSSIVEIVQRCPAYTLVIEGHTDSVGGAELNQRLSEARARSVLEFLARSGVDGGRLRSVGFGETRPVQPNDTDWNRSRNRRIEFAIAR